MGFDGLVGYSPNAMEKNAIGRQPLTVILAGAEPAGALFDALCTSYGILEATEKYNKCLYGN